LSDGAKVLLSINPKRGRVSVITLDADCRTREISEKPLIRVALRELDDVVDLAPEDAEAEDGIISGRVGVAALELIGVAEDLGCKEAEAKDGIISGRVGVVALGVCWRRREDPEMWLIDVVLREP